MGSIPIKSFDEAVKESASRRSNQPLSKWGLIGFRMGDDHSRSFLLGERVGISHPEAAGNGIESNNRQTYNILGKPQANG